MKRSGRWKVAAVATLAVGTVFLSSAALFALLSPSAPIAFAENYDRRAYRMLTAPPTPGRLDGAEAAARKALALSPYSNSARLRLTYIDTVRRGSLGPVGHEHLAKSYDLVPIDHTVAAWRVGFALEHWTEVSPEVRRAVELEARLFARAGSRDADVVSRMRSIQSPEGRLAAALWLRTLAR